MYKMRKNCSIREQVDAIGLTFIRIHALIKSSAEHINNPSRIEDIPLNFPKWPWLVVTNQGFIALGPVSVSKI